MKKSLLVSTLLLLITLSISAGTRNCSTSNGYMQTVDGNIKHYQSTGCTPFLEPFDCTVEVDFQGPPPPNVSCLNGDIILIDFSTEIQLDNDLFRALPQNDTSGVSCQGGKIGGIIYTKSGRELTEQDRIKAGICH